MCGIVGAVAQRPVEKILIEGLKKLEYRGYDSAGVALIDAKHDLHRMRVAGKVRELEQAMQQHTQFAGNTGIAHTRWATHGIPSEKNAHPFVSNKEFALVHNGIIENHLPIRDKLIAEGYAFLSDTDTEVIVHLIHKNYIACNDLILAIRITVNELEGAFALGIIAKKYPNRLIAVRQGCPLVIGKGVGENFIASDPLALLALTQQFIYLEDNDLADISLTSIKIFNSDLEPINRQSHTLAISLDTVERGEYRHYMKKEIMEQAKAVEACLEARVSTNKILPAIFGHQAQSIFDKIEHLQFVACGTSYHAALVARYWIEAICDIPCSVEVASEFRYRKNATPKNSLFVTLSQSGETADTLAALRLVKKLNYLSTLIICNAPGSTMMREAELHFLTRAGIEIGVASTKAFTTQLISLLLLTMALPGAKYDAELMDALRQLPQTIDAVLKHDNVIAEWAKTFIKKQHAIFISRGSLYPIALEGALKMKEISYIHAEGYPSGELKHGPLALVDTNMPVIAAAPKDSLMEKNISNLREVRTRGGNLYIMTDDVDTFQHEAFEGAHILALPKIHPLLMPIIYTIPMQLLAYHVAVLKGTDVDQPRNLAKSVTVE